MIGPTSTSRINAGTGLWLAILTACLGLCFFTAGAMAQNEDGPPAETSAPTQDGGPAPASDGGIGTGGTVDETTGVATDEGEDPIAVAEEAKEPTTWRTALPRFWKYFGVLGVVLVLLTIAAVVWMIHFTLRSRGGRFVWTGALAAAGGVALLLTTRTTGSIDMAIICAAVLIGAMVLFLLRGTRIQLPLVVLVLAAFFLGEWSSSRISAIDVDRSAQEAKMRQAQEKQEQSKPGGNIAEGRTAVEVSEEDKRLLEEAAEEDEPENEYEAAAKREEVPEYMRRGKQQRDPTRLSAEGDEDGEAFDKDFKVDQGRALPPGDVIRANRWDVFMLGLTRWVPWIGLFILLAAYLDRFNRSTGSRAPLPLSNRGFDAMFPKPMFAFFQDDREALAQTLREVAQKGESFIYVGPDDPLPEESSLNRLLLMPRRGLWPLRKLVMPAVEAEQRHPFVFESAWFRRLCFVVTCDRDPGAFVDRLIERLNMRKVTKAVARRTLNIVLDDVGVPDAARLRELARLARRANVKLIIRSGEQTGDLPDDLFDEIINDGESLILQTPEPTPTRSTASPTGRSPAAAS